MVILIVTVSILTVEKFWVRNKSKKDERRESESDNLVTHIHT